jgi:peptidoglycan hydrolase-like protein with peptidoglycan-binding domain
MRLATCTIVAILSFGVWGASQTKPPATSPASPPAKSAATTSKTGSAKKTSSTKKSSTAKHAASKTGSKTPAKKVVARQTVPDGDRSREIQSALKTQGYLNGEPSGKWDAATTAALAKYQQDHGVKATGKPDARSLINLGLGPKYDNQIQPKVPATQQQPNNQ